MVRGRSRQVSTWGGTRTYGQPQNSRIGIPAVDDQARPSEGRAVLIPEGAEQQPEHRPEVSPPALDDMEVVRSDCTGTNRGIQVGEAVLSAGRQPGAAERGQNHAGGIGAGERAPSRTALVLKTGFPRSPSQRLEIPAVARYGANGRTLQSRGAWSLSMPGDKAHRTPPALYGPGGPTQ